MPSTNKIELLRDMKLNASSLDIAIKDCDWKVANAAQHILLQQIKELELLLAASPLPPGYQEKCTCLNCIPPDGVYPHD